MRSPAAEASEASPRGRTGRQAEDAPGAVDEALEEALEDARAAGLRYSTDTAPGITRVRRGSGFEYLDERGSPIEDRGTLDRIARLAVPPAWTRVWINPDPRGHLQATGRDARRRKQYRYHERWRDVRDESKYERIIPFAMAIPAIRARVARDIASPTLTKEKVLATVVRLLDESLIRVGNPAYARENGSFGLTTLRGRHVKVTGDTIRFRFRGKSGRDHDLAVNDRSAARVVRRLQDLPGQDLFRYVGDDGETHPVGSADVNSYLEQAAGEKFTAKDFRTWAGTVLTLEALLATGPPRSPREARRKVSEAIKSVARELGNTPAVCRRCYVHPEVLTRFEAGRLRDAGTAVRRKGLRAREARVLAILTREAG